MPLPPLRGRVFLAPMAGVNDPAFRLMCRMQGSALNFTDMISANSVVRGTVRAMGLVATAPGDEPTAVQLFGRDPETLARAVRVLENDRPDLVRPAMFDLNLGCPVKKVTRRGAGCALLEHPDRIERLVSAMRSATDLPVSVKVRLGLVDGDRLFPEAVRAAQRGGADLVTVHARYADDGYSGRARWECIREVKEALDVPVAGNGDVVDGPSADRMLEETGCDYVMVGRAARGDPHVFARINGYLQTGTEPRPVDRAAQFAKYYGLAKKWGVRRGAVKLQAMYFTRGMPDSKRLRTAIKALSEPEDILSCVRRG